MMNQVAEVYSGIITLVYDVIKQFRFKHRYIFVKVKIFIKRIQGKKINVLFLLMHASVWPYDGVYTRFESDSRFRTNIIVVPYTLYGKDEMLRTLNEAKKLFCNERYNAFPAYNEKTDEYVDVKTMFDPDIVFFTNPHEITEKQYYINHFTMDSLTCYVPYGIYAANLQEMQFNQPFHNLLWRHFLPSQLHMKMAVKYSRNKGTNAFVTGYPKCDVYCDKKNKFDNPWKDTGKKLKRLIWAPHHTLESNEYELGYSTFDTYSQSMIELVSKYKDSVQFALKPHPLLWLKLRHYNDWNDTQIAEYRNFWLNGDNTQLEEGEYLDLFFHSDGMLLDSISFISEYLYLNKPHAFLINDDYVAKKFNEYGQLVFELMYKGSTISEIESFIEDVIILGNDKLAINRSCFTKKYLLSSAKRLASDIIFNQLSKTII